jgi:hypothetical protein
MQNEYQGLQTKMNTFVCKLAPILYYIIFGRVKGFPIKTTHLIVTVWENCYNSFCGNRGQWGKIGV